MGSEEKVFEKRREKRDLPVQKLRDSVAGVFLQRKDLNFHFIDHFPIETKYTTMTKKIGAKFFSYNGRVGGRDKD